MSPQTPRLHRRALGALGIAALAGAGLGGQVVRSRFLADLQVARSRVAQGSQVVQTRSGPIEVGISAGNRPLLMVHGTGGGFDQGLLFAQRLADAGWRVIAPSRFGYLRTPFPADASTDAQADALADLLDALGIARLPVLGGSAGALPALAFALRYPARCSALVPIVPASYVPGRPATPAPAPWAERVIESLLGSDFAFWCGATLAPQLAVKALLATDAAVVAAAAADEQARVRQILWHILPISERVQGLRNDARLASHPPPMPFERITAPTLAVSVQDDRFGTFAAAQHLAATVPGARLLSWPTGGHVWVGHDAELAAEVDAFLRTRS
jgi:pimeloyl-ACP methyl ester carboxylesterase